MDPKQQMAGVAGIALVGVNLWTGPGRHQIGDVIWGGGQTDTGHKALLALGGQLLFVGVLVFFAGGGDGAANVVLALIAALWVLWGINRYGNKSTQAPAGGNTNPAHTAAA